DKEDADLAVVLLAEPAVVLAGHPGAVPTLLGEGGLVDDPDNADPRAGGRGDQLVDEQRLGLVEHVVISPGGAVDELLQARDVAMPDRLRYRLDALALGADQEPLEGVAGGGLGLLLAHDWGGAGGECGQLLR